MLLRIFFIAPFLLLGAWGAALAQGESSALRTTPSPKLVILLVIDQFRSDYLTRFGSRFLPAKGKTGLGGFNALLERGAYYPLAEHETLQCMTGPGHAALLTGSHPYANGIPVNNWYDQTLHRPFYCVEDPSIQSIGGDPKKLHGGTSPKTLLGTTVSDEWKNAGFPGRIISIAVKDRAAILMAGHRADLAVWHDPNTFQWISSKRYLPEGALPGWVDEMNTELRKEKGEKMIWNAEGKGTGFSEESLHPDKKYLWGLDNSFPHHYLKGERRSLSSPYGLEITTRLALRALSAEKLGQEKRTDFLFISLSLHDYIAHGFGPNSREIEELTVAEDREISKLLNAVDKKIGLENTVIALSADHGGGHAPEYIEKYGLPGGRIDEGKLQTEINNLLTKRFGKLSGTEKWMPFSDDLTFYLNHAALDAKDDKSRLEAEELVRKYLETQPGAGYVVTATDALLKRVPPGELGRRFLLSYFPGRSGDIIMIPRAGWISGDSYATHMTAYSYDRYVPLILTGRSFKPGRYAQSAKAIDLAPTLSFLLGITPPSLSEGRVLSEALK